MSRVESASYSARRLGVLATEIPGATALFRKHKLDFCCNGAVTLFDAATAKGLDPEQIAFELAALSPADSAVPREPNALIVHIIKRYHEVHRRELPELIRLAKRVEAVHGSRDDAPKGLADLLGRFAAELDSHMQKEEFVLFPLMEQGGHPMIGHPIAQMRAEHLAAGEELRSLEPFGRPAPRDACPTWRALNAGIAKFADDLMNHIHLENNLLFPMFECCANECGCS